MKQFLPFLYISAFFLFPFACKQSAPVIQDTSSYIESVEQWQQNRLEGLKGKDGWLNLAGIYWLKDGKQTLGSDPSNDIVFPAKAPAFIGTIYLKDSLVHLSVNNDVELVYENETVRELDLSYDSSGEPSYITHGDFAWYIMKRHTSLAIRLRDYKNPAIEALDQIPPLRSLLLLPVPCHPRKTICLSGLRRGKRHSRIIKRYVYSLIYALLTKFYLVHRHFIRFMNKPESIQFRLQLQGIIRVA